MAVQETEETKDTPQIQAPVMKVEFSLEDSSPRGVLEIPISSSDSDNSSICGSSISRSGSNVSGDRDQTILEKSNSQKSPGKDNGHVLQWKNMIDNFKKMSSVRKFSVVPLFSSYELSRKQFMKKLSRLQGTGDDKDLSVTKPTWKNFDYAELAAATHNFSSENLIGKGGHAEVYKGKLHDGQLVAIKMIMKNEKEEEDRVSDFLAELGIIAHINHKNAARLIGFSTDSGLYLFYIAMIMTCSIRALALTKNVMFPCLVAKIDLVGFRPPLHVTYDERLRIAGSSECLEWKIRFQVAVGIAEGLQYLHHDCHRRIIHRDITASNILLTENYDAQITDFGLAKWLPENWTNHVVHPIEGTFGYLAPEYFMHGIVDEKTDVFAFGVLLLEIITGRRAVDSDRQSLVLWAKPLLESNNCKGLADSQLGDAYDSTEIKRAMLTASMCLHHMPTTRPYMNQVVQILKGEDTEAEMDQKSPSRRSMIFDGDLQDYNSNSYIKDINRHMELVME
ncbi:hypothetical protein ACFE04_017332 [Oxalis oulophora]